MLFKKITTSEFFIKSLIIFSLIDLYSLYSPNFLEFKFFFKFIVLFPLIIIGYKGLISHYRIILFISFFTIILNIFYPNSYNAIYSLRLIGFIVVFSIFYYSINHSNFSYEKLNYYLKIFFSIYLISSLLGLYLGKNIVYEANGFSGTSGGFEAANEYSYLVIIFNILFSSKLILNKRFILIDFSFFLLSELNCFLLSTKSAIFFSILNIFFLLFLINKKIFISLIFTLLFNYDKFNFLFENINSLSRIIFFTEKNDFIWAITSGRSERLSDLNINYFSFFPNLNIFLNFEMDLFDIFINMGLAGFIIYFYIIYWVMKISKINIFYFFYSSILIFLSITSGHLLNSVAVAPFFAIYFSLMNRKH